MKPKYNCFLTYWPWLLPAGLVMAAVGLALGYFGILPDYWSGFALGCGGVFAITGAGMLIARLWHKKKN